MYQSNQSGASPFSKSTLHRAGVSSESSVSPASLPERADILQEQATAIAERDTAKTSSELLLELLISNLLKYGVIIASTIVFVGGILYLIRHGSEPVNYRLFRGEPDIFRSPIGVLEAVLSGRRRGIIQLGILVLIATPIVRVAISCLTFLRQGDFTYVFLTALVLSGLIYSLLGAYF